MHPFFEFLLKANTLLVCFYLIYKVFINQDTFFNFSRYYLLIGMIFSVILPLITFTKIVYIEIQDTIELPIVKKHVVESISKVEPTLIEKTINWDTIILNIYLIIVGLLALRLLLGLVQIIKLIKKSEIEKRQKYYYIKSHLIESPFSFFNYIIYNPELINQEELDVVLRHEEEHSNQNHSVDTILVQLIKIFFWFNPVVWLYQKSVVQNLEFLADKGAISKVDNKIVYQKTMLKFNAKAPEFAFINSFNQSLIKKRIVMLNKAQTNRKNVWKYGLILPVLVGFILLFQIETVAQERKSKRKLEKTQKLERLNNKSIVLEQNLELKDIDSIMKIRDGEIALAELEIEKSNNEIEKSKAELDKVEIEIEKAELELQKAEAQNEKRLIIINGKEYRGSEFKGNIIVDGKLTHYDNNDAVEKFGEKGKYGAIIIDGDVKYDTRNEININNDKSKSFELSNGDVCLLLKGRMLKIPGYPTFDFQNKNNQLYIDGKKIESFEEFYNYNHKLLKTVNIERESGKYIIYFFTK